jgi:bifunctional ADP-heptose synthase (sugar kinase/adenylyltransferase)
VKQLKVLLIGDYCLDTYKYGVVERISPEAPVPIFKQTYIKNSDGMGGNVEKNLINLGIEVLSYLKGHSNKVRLIDEKSKQHILRVDDDVIIEPLEINDIDPNHFDVDAIVISDYEKGCVTYDLVKNLRKMTTVPIFIDTKKKNLEVFEGCYVKINESEYNAATTFNSDLIVTRGGHLVSYQSNTYEVPEVNVFDVCGAGDTFLSSLVYKFLLDEDIHSAIRFAIVASSITVQHIGVYAPSLEEINAT